MKLQVVKEGNGWVFNEINVFVSRTNIPGNDIKAGKEICHYLPPFPAMGTGYHRFVFLLFKQERPIDFSEDVRPTPCHSLKMRTFSTFDFYRKHEDSMTPAGLAFFQCQWDSSVTWVFHQLLSKKRSVGECCTGLLRGRAVPRTSRTPSVNELLLGSG
ncbi:39S ribosomal protein L38, mitochondrial [Anas platyrhynchos]|uniref:39S ribosomal protein L38, mitochondrial n=1 Tax=Anas platyrhynchos TaxID=8839 RepID=R0KXM4_ANAPL|nr:39S ribosomal protein L38, mitochondrial [Anas platyrhynchos]